jgi:hypothetical protein
MSKIAAAGILLLPSFAMAQQPSPQLTIGWLSYSAGVISQDVSVQNNGWHPLKTVRIRCRFFLYAKQLSAGTVEIHDIGSNAAGYQTMTAASRIEPNSASCDMVSFSYRRVSD